MFHRALGLEVMVADDWVPKELTLIARVATTPSLPPRAVAPDLGRTHVEKDLARLSRLRESARRLAARGDLGLFGTSIAATWLFAELDGSVGFFVDEDPNRVGKTFLDRPVFHPCQVAAGSHVLLALPGPIAMAIHRRVARQDVVYHLPPGA
jgi:hypothetical protein